MFCENLVGGLLSTSLDLSRPKCALLVCMYSGIIFSWRRLTIMKQSYIIAPINTGYGILMRSVANLKKSPINKYKNKEANSPYGPILLQ